MQNRFQVFLDLEDTVIDRWDPHMIYPAKGDHLLQLFKFLDRLKVPSVGIFSNAIYNECDKQICIDLVAPYIKQELNVNINEIITLQDMMKYTMCQTSVYYDSMYDYLTDITKMQSFINAMLMRKQPGTYVLIDDAVQNSTMIYHDHNIKLEFVQIKSGTSLRKIL